MVCSETKMLLGDVTFKGKSTITGHIYRVNEFYPGLIRS